MHTYIMVRGERRNVETFITDLEAQLCPYQLHGQDHLLKVAVRPIWVLEVAYPKQAEAKVKKCLMPYGMYNTEKLSKAIYFMFLPIVKALGIKKNKVKSVGKYTNYGVIHPYVDVVVLGDKDDRTDADGTEKI